MSNSDADMFMKIFHNLQVMDSSSSSSEDDIIIHSIVNVIVQDRSALHKWCGKTPGCRANILRGGCTWYRDYLRSNSIYTASHSRRRFRITLNIYRQLERKLPLVKPELKQKRGVTGKPGVTTWQKILLSLRWLADESSYPSLDDQARMGIESMRMTFLSFIRALKKYYGKQFLNRTPNEYELRSLEQEFFKRNFLGFIGSLNCMNMH